MLILETCQDLLQVKRAVIAVFEVMRGGREIPLMVSVTLESSGLMLVGSDIGAVAATLEPFPIASLGLNCATGPSEMESHIRYLSENWERPVSCMPNQGLPEIRDGKTVYPLKPEEFARKMLHFVQAYGIAYAGGCCGTSPAHIKAMTEALAGGGFV
jgi:5-methyltetrahydrofolate--homocysteine methyltransferase